MKPIPWICLSAICCLLLTARQTAAHDWMRGRGLDLEMRIHGRVALPGGVREEDVVVEGFTQLKNGGDQRVFRTDMQADFDVWIPVNRDKIWSLRILASTVDGKWYGTKFLDGSEFRKAAQSKLSIELQPCTRRIDVSTVLGNRPISGATVIARFDFGQEFTAPSNENGVAIFQVPENLKLTGFTSWADDHCIGGFQFARGPQRDPTENQFTIELFECRTEKFQFIDDAGVAIPYLPIRFQIATPEPHFNFIGNNPHFDVATDAQGEIDFYWMPNWDSVYYYPEILSNEWIMPNPDPIDSGEGFNFILKKQTEIQRVRVRGEVQEKVRNETGVDVAGFIIELRTFESGLQDHIDYEFAYSDEDGQFEFEGIESSTYCAWLHDPDWVAEIVDFKVPENGSLDAKTEIVLLPEQGEAIEISVTDSDNQPVAGLAVAWSKEHEVEWIRNGKRNFGTQLLGQWTRTDQHGIAKGRALPGPLVVAINTPLWRERKAIVIVADEVNKVTFQQPEKPEK